MSAVCIVTLNSRKLTFRQHIYLCVPYFPSNKTAIISLFSIHRLVFVMAAHGVLCGVRIISLFSIHRLVFVMAAHGVLCGVRIISLFSIHRLVFVMKTHGVLCGVRIISLFSILDWFL